MGCQNRSHDDSCEGGSYSFALSLYEPYMLCTYLASLALITSVFATLVPRIL